jgi:hypothetical protein
VRKRELPLTMEFQHVNIKIFVAEDRPVDLRKIIEVFHRWTASQTLDELLIDVADYRHVSAGPGVVLVGHEADYALDNARNRQGLLYNRKLPIEGSTADRVRQALRAAAAACDRLEAELAGELKFDRQQFELTINDRCLAPNTAETLAACRTELQAFLAQLGHADARIVHADSDPRRRFGVSVQLSRPLEL